jgi:ribulose-bisphosphate carboxylase large chain
MATFRVTYLIDAAADEIDARAQAVAIEQSVEVPLQAVRSPEIMRSSVGRVAGIRAHAPGTFAVEIEFSVAISGLEPAQFMNVLFGNTSLQPTVQVWDVDLPPELLAAFGGPKFGMAGLRDLVSAPTRPLTATALKPMGLSPAELGELCATLARGGIDIIKDDHGLANQAFSPFDARVRACQDAVNRVEAETGHRAIYVPNMAGTPSALFRQAEIVDEVGVRAVMVSPMLVGLPAFHELVHEHLRVPVLGHPAFGGAVRIAPELLLGKLFRLFGADAVIFPNYGGRFSYSQATCTQLANNMGDPWGELLPAIPAPAGGMSVERVQEMIDFYGNDVMLLIGGSLLVADDIEAQAREFVENVHAMGRN